MVNGQQPKTAQEAACRAPHRARGLKLDVIRFVGKLTGREGVHDRYAQPA